MAWTSSTVAGRGCRSSMTLTLIRRGAAGRAGAQVGALAFATEEAEEFDGLSFRGGAEPVRDTGVELRRLAGAEGEVVVAETEPESAVEHVDPLVPLMGLQFFLSVSAAAAGRDHQLVRLDAARTLGQRDHGHAVPLDRAQVDARVTGERSVDEFVKRHAVRPGEGKQQFKGGLAVA